MEPYLNEYGLVIYSNKSTLRRNPVVFYGLNPGCDPDIGHPIRWTIEKSLDHFEDGFKTLQETRDSAGSSLNLINDQCWPGPRFEKDGKKGFRPDYPEGQAPYQRRVRFLLEAIAHPDALVTNLYFLQTRDAEQLEAILSKEFVKACWEVHELLFKITEPRVIITCHDVTEEVFCGKFVLGSKPVEIEAKHGNWKCRRLQGQWKSREICEVKIPHLSIYDITQPRCRTVLEWVKKIVRECTDGWEMQAPAGV